MANAFAEITFTPSVKAAQSLYGSRQANQGFELSEDAGNKLAKREVTLVPKLQLGNPVSEAPASRLGKLELPRLHSQAGAWERAKIAA